MNGTLIIAEAFPASEAGSTSFHARLVTSEQTQMSASRHSKVNGKEMGALLRFSYNNSVCQKAQVFSFPFLPKLRDDIAARAITSTLFPRRREEPKL